MKHVHSPSTDAAAHADFVPVASGTADKSNVKSKELNFFHIM